MVKIAIDGNIGCGKSTVIKNLGNKGYTVFAEDIESWGDWLNMYYDNPKKNALGFQMTVLLSHLKQQKQKNTGDVIYERCSHTCNRIFGSLLLDDGILETHEYDLCKSFEKEFNNSVDVVIYLQTTPEICKKRIQKRDRSCESSINIDYLKNLHNKYESVYKDTTVDGKKIIIIDALQPTDIVLNEVLTHINKLEADVVDI